MDRGKATLNLAAAEARTPPLDGPGAWAEKLLEAAYGAVSPDDVGQIMAAQVAKAKDGNTAAAKFVTGLLLPAQGGRKPADPGPPPAPLPEPPLVLPGPPVKLGEVHFATPTIELMRRAAGSHLLYHGPTATEALAHLLGLGVDDLGPVVRCPDFQFVDRLWTLTPTGRQAYG